MSKRTDEEIRKHLDDEHLKELKSLKSGVRPSVYHMGLPNRYLVSESKKMGIAWKIDYSDPDSLYFDAIIVEKEK